MSETAILIINEFVLVLRRTSLKNVSTTKLFPANAAKLTTAMNEVRTIDLIGEHSIVSSKVEFSNIFLSQSRIVLSLGQSFFLVSNILFSSLTQLFS